MFFGPDSRLFICYVMNYRVFTFYIHFFALIETQSIIMELKDL